MVGFMRMKQRMRISKGGQVSIPAPIRHRWATSTLTLEDRGDSLILTPAPDDPIAAAAGSLAEYGPVDVAELRAQARKDERLAERRRVGS
jgi:bifunctional DNA-binding transcriptional regulator/antitoxin component of YhaV-PrlF toxin-antitoxin module